MRVARFEEELELPPGEPHLFASAAAAIEREMHDASRWKRLICREVSLVRSDASGAVFALHVGQGVEFDWTWEGAVAFRPRLLKEFEQATWDALDDDSGWDAAYDEEEELTDEDRCIWFGDLLEVEPAAGLVFVMTSDPSRPPRRGSFYVRPFVFLAALNDIYNGDPFPALRQALPERLAAAQGNIHPDVVADSDVGLEPLKDWWGNAWSVLWGPPGTGKTYTIGQQVARVLEDDPSERILVVSTTNRATDGAAISVGRAAREQGAALAAALDAAPDQNSKQDVASSITRIGNGANIQSFRDERLTNMLRGAKTETLARVEKLKQEHSRAVSPAQRASIQQQIHLLRRELKDVSLRSFVDPEVRLVVGTAFKATRLLCSDEVRQEVAAGRAPFTTIFIDEAGLMPRVAIAALSLLAARRVVLVGDSKQLAPISRISRLLEPQQGNWLAKSGVSHLHRIDIQRDGVHVLREQRRMHDDICQVVSRFQYEGQLTTAADRHRPFSLPRLWQHQPRAIWYVLDEDHDDLPAIRAARGPGNRSWVRQATLKVLEKLLQDRDLRGRPQRNGDSVGDGVDDENDGDEGDTWLFEERPEDLEDIEGMFVTPFKAQARAVQSYLAAQQIHGWSASTVHSQQGAEADIVLFDTVNAGSCNWPYDEWKRLVNVAISRARHAVVVLASRAEMQEPYLQPLLHQLEPRVLRRAGNRWQWTELESPNNAASHPTPAPQSLDVPSENTKVTLGDQLDRRSLLRPVLSSEQQRLCNYELDGKPRLVRGVAGSGKTVVLAHWLSQTVQRLNDPDARIWAVFANQSLKSLIGSTVEAAWSEIQAAAGQTRTVAFPWDQVSLFHIRDVLSALLHDAKMSMGRFGFDYDAAAAAFLPWAEQNSIRPRCDAMFIDEAQDMGPHTLKVLAALVRPSDPADENSRAIHIFYDNAQNIYGRGTPTWSDFGIDMRGRSAVMKESFRSTRPIMEFALNVLYRLEPPESNPDHRELVRRGLVERQTTPYSSEPTSNESDAPWWHVRFNQIDGPLPEFRQYPNADAQYEAVARYCRKLIEQQAVRPTDICLVYNGPDSRRRLLETVAPALAEINVQVSVQTKKPFQRAHNEVLATTAHSFKGYDAEIVIVPAADQFVAAETGILASALYVAMTRARSVLTLFGRRIQTPEAQRLYDVFHSCSARMNRRMSIARDDSLQDDLVELAKRIGREHVAWLRDLARRFGIHQEPLTTPRGEIVAEPLFSIRAGGKWIACFEKPLSNAEMERVEKLGVRVVMPGETVVAEP